MTTKIEKRIDRLEQAITERRDLDERPPGIVVVLAGMEPTAEEQVKIDTALATVREGFCVVVLPGNGRGDGPCP